MEQPTKPNTPSPPLLADLTNSQPSEHTPCPTHPTSPHLRISCPHREPRHAHPNPHTEELHLVLSRPPQPFHPRLRPPAPRAAPRARRRAADRAGLAAAGAAAAADGEAGGVAGEPGGAEDVGRFGRAWTGRSRNGRRRELSIPCLGYMMS